MRRWLDRRMYRKMAEDAAFHAALCRRNQFPQRESNGIIPGSDFWRTETERHLDNAVALYLRAGAMRPRRASEMSWTTTSSRN